MRHALPSVMKDPQQQPCAAHCRDLCRFYDKMLLAPTKQRKAIFADFQEQVIPQQNAESWQIYRYGPDQHTWHSARMLHAAHVQAAQCSTACAWMHKLCEPQLPSEWLATPVMQAASAQGESLMQSGS